MPKPIAPNAERNKIFILLRSHKRIRKKNKALRKAQRRAQSEEKHNQAQERLENKIGVYDLPAGVRIHA